MLIHRVSWLSLLGRCDGLERFVDPPFRIDVQGWAADSCRRHRTADYSSVCLATYCFGWNGRSVRLRDAFYRLESAAIVGSWCCFAARLRGVIGWLPRVIVWPATEWVQRPRFLVPAAVMMGQAASLGE